ncbi:MAG: amidase, partial [Owenweeksia sp.]
MDFNTLTEVQNKLTDGTLTCTQLVEEHLKRIEDNEHLNAFLEVFAHDARSRATVIDQKISRGSAGRLAGMIIGIKDNICFKGHTVSASSKILEGFSSLYSSTVVDRLLEEDAIIIGRLNCDEFAMGSSNEFSAFGAVKNPKDITRVSGGSSGGSAAAVAARLCHAALGSDTGGSIRQPASFCGVVGFKPTYGRVSR